MRCFIAVDVPEDLKEKILGVQEQLKKTGADLKLVEKENLHFTIKFLGEVNERQVEEVKSFLGGLEEGSFEVSIKSLGVFPNESYIKVIWLGVEEGKDVFVDLIKKINEGLEKIRKETKELNAHLTIARVKTAKNKEKLKTIIQRLKEVEIGRINVDSLKLMASELGPEGPRYQVLAEFKLK